MVRLRNIPQGAFGAATVAIATFLLFTKAPQDSTFVAAGLGMLLVFGNTQMEYFFIRDIFWRGQPYTGGQSASTAGLPIGTNPQIGTFGLVMMAASAATYFLTDLPAHNSLAVTILGIQAMGGIMMAIRGFAILDVEFTPDMDTMMTIYLVVNTILCVVALTITGLDAAWWQLNIALQLVWITLGFTHHFRPLRDWIRARNWFTVPPPVSLYR